MENALCVKETAERIADMRIRGAGRIARSAALALGEMASGFKGAELSDFKSKLELSAAELVATRPTAVSLSNAVGLVVRSAAKAGTVDEARESVTRAASDFARASETAVKRLAVVAAAKVPKGARVLTHCNSSAAVAAIIRAHQNGGVEAFCTETRPWRQGRITARELAAAGVPVTLVVDSSAGLLMPDIDIVLVGADTVEWDGSLLNKVGTSQLACAAARNSVPFVCCAESYKFAPPSQAGKRREIELRSADEVLDGAELPDVKVWNPVFDRTVPGLINSYATEHGEVAPAGALDFARKHLEGL
ncbi:MAG: S-methyl-5-thioribose-1-phosphate isomerase [Methanobacteriota archaeon]